MTYQHSDIRMPVWPTLIIVSGWEWYGLAEKCNVLPFYILNSGSHEPLQGDASSDFKRNFNLDAPCYLSPSEPSNVKTAPAFLFFCLIKHRDRDHLAQWYGERSKRWRQRPLRGMSTGRQSCLTSASSDLRHQVQYTAFPPKHCHPAGALLACSRI